MRFEKLLARKYIVAQKRHSILTMCSIIIAVAMMSMLFTGYATLESCMRAVSYENNPYHIRICNLTEGQSDILEKLDELKSFNETKNSDGTYQADLIYHKDGIKENIYEYIEELAKKIGIDEMECEAWLTNGNILFNDSLMNYDLVTDDSRFERLQSICLLFVYAIFIALALRLIIDTAFEISSKERERQFGVLQSIGATPKQIVKIITAEGFILSMIAIPLGLALGVGIAYFAFKLIINSGIAGVFVASDRVDDLMKLKISPLMLLCSAIVGLVWVLLSAYGTGMRIIKMSPVEAISSRSNNVKKVKKHSLLGLLFGWTGILASRNAMRQRKRFIITILSLTISMSLFASGTCVIDAFAEFETLMYNEVETSDFYITPTYSYFEPLGYRDTLNKLKKSGYFKNFKLSETKLAQIEYGGEIRTVSVEYMNEYTYNDWFDGKPPISYDEMKKSESYIFCSTTKRPDKNIKSLDGTITMYNVPEEKREEYNYEIRERDGFYEYSPSFFDMRDKAAEEIKVDKRFDIAATYEYNIHSDFLYSEDEPEEYLFLISTLDRYEEGVYEQYGNVARPIQFGFDLVNENQHAAAIRYLNKTEGLTYYDDSFGEMQSIRTVFSAVSIAENIITVMIALIAIVNMVNIISTGIINRRSEIASMRCFGMTDGQLYKLIIIESIQYTLFATIGAIILCTLLIFGTERFIILTELTLPADIGALIPYSKPVMKVLGASLVSLAISILAGLTPLKRMQKNPLTDQLRSID